ncbi:APC family permease [Polynucleobacter rarus]|uniref:APC family permease n=1 Tax=Polynucleobacter rarus TaxID=556055 RepID=UPI000D3EC424|nr:APC family permease [Polynucleobacter rarus]
MEKIINFFRGKALDPMDPKTRHAISIIPLLAWVGLGADGLSSSCYGPEEAFLALGANHNLALFLAMATAVTVFIIALGYNQIIELFPTGGGGYKVATALLGSKAGLISGSALLVDYVLTIAISLASGVDAAFSLVPPEYQDYKLIIELGLVVFMIFLNFRGIKESILILLPIFLGFCITHAILIAYGIGIHAPELGNLFPNAISEANALGSNLGWIMVASLFLKAYSLGGGTYTGLEAVSNNVNTLAEPKVPHGKRTMWYLAFSLAITAGGIILLYMLWGSQKVDGQTLNATAFGAIINHLNPNGGGVNDIALAVVLLLEAGLLFVAAQAGFLDGPTVLSNMATDYWVPRQFRELSSRLVRQNGILVMGIAAFLILIFTGGSVATLVVLYSINVFLTFSLSLFGMSVYWVKHSKDAGWIRHFLLSALGFVVTASILAITISEKLFEGGWLTILVTSVVVVLCLLTRKHYENFRVQLSKADEAFPDLPAGNSVTPLQIDKSMPAAIVLVSRHRGASMHALMWAMRLFPHYKNYVFVAVGEVDATSFEGHQKMEELKEKMEKSMSYYVDFCHQHGLAATSKIGFGTDPIKEFMKLTDEAYVEFPNESVCFSSKLLLAKANFFTKFLHNQTPLEIQERLHFSGRQMILLPMRVG